MDMYKMMAPISGAPLDGFVRISVPSHKNYRRYLFKIPASALKYYRYPFKITFSEFIIVPCGKAHLWLSSWALWHCYYQKKLSYLQKKGIPKGHNSKSLARSF